MTSCGGRMALGAPGARGAAEWPAQAIAAAQNGRSIGKIGRLLEPRSVAALRSRHALVHQPPLDQHQVVRHLQSRLTKFPYLGLHLGVALSGVIRLFELVVECSDLTLHLVRHNLRRPSCFLVLSLSPPDIPRTATPSVIRLQWLHLSNFSFPK